MHEHLINWQDWKDIELTSACILPAWRKLLYALLIPSLNWNMQCDSWFRQDSRKRSHSSSRNKTIFPTQGPKCLPQASFLSFQHCEEDNLLARMETGKRMVLSQWSLADTCMPALSSVLVIDMNWINAWTPHQLARLERHWTSTSACILPARQKLLYALLIPSLNWNMQCDSWFRQDSRKRSHSSSRNKTIFPTQGPKCLPQASFLSFQHCEEDNLLARMETGKRMVLSQWSLADTCMPALSSVLVIDMYSINAWTPHQLARLERHWTSTSETSAYSLPAWHQLFTALLILALKWNRQRDSW